MTRTGLRSLGIVLTAFVVGFAAILVGCLSVAPVAVTDIEAVTGTWKGILYPSSSEQVREAITLTIREDGSYDVVSAQSIGTSRGKGRIAISEGRVIFEGERGRGVGKVLRDTSGNLLMEVDATLSDNSTLSAKLSRSEATTPSGRPPR
jgi:hypothetical protein